MTLPSILFALLIALFYGALYHLFRGGGPWRLLLYLGVSALGFAVGHLVGWWREWVFVPLGSLNLGASTLGSFLFLYATEWFSRFESRPQSKV